MLWKHDSKCIFIDDFMKAGGTAKGIRDLIKRIWKWTYWNWSSYR